MASSRGDRSGSSRARLTIAVPISLPCGTAQQCCPPRAGLPANADLLLSRMMPPCGSANIPDCLFNAVRHALARLSHRCSSTGYDEPEIPSYAISPFCPTGADGLQIPHMRLEDLTAGISLNGLEPSAVATIVAVVPIAEGAVQLIYKTPDGTLKDRL